MIKKIDKIKNFGIFKNLKWCIPEFSKFNLIYGWNYSGKTTISRIFRCVELEVLHNNYRNAEFEIVDDNNYQITHDNLGGSSYQFRVFNSDYIEDNLNWDNQEAKPIFVLGKKNIELQKEIKQIEQKIKELIGKDKNEGEKITNINTNLENKLTSKARELDRIKPPYDKRNLKKSLEKIKSDSEKYLSKKDVQGLIKTLKASRLELLSEISIILLPQNKKVEIIEILDRTAVSRTIERLKNNSALSNWIKKGLDLHKEKKSCEFCGGSLSKKLLEEYNNHFSEEYENMMEELNTLIGDIEKYKILVSIHDEKRLYPHLEEDYKVIKGVAELYINEYNKNIKKMVELLREKINNPFKKLTGKLICPIDICINDILRKLNKVIDEHNDTSDNFKKNQGETFKKLELHYACEFNKDNDYFVSLKELEELNKKSEKNKNDIEEQKDKKIEIEAQLSDIAIGATRINQYLSSMFGREHIIIEVIDKDKFKILRDGYEARNLSSGERTAIAFSHFLTRLEDKDTDISKAIAFIDDPISSLDSNHLYNTFALIQAKLNKCHQLIISTHNHEFFNLIKEWLKKIKGKKCRFYLNERIIKNRVETSDIKELPTLLLNFRSEYHFLFFKIKSFADNPRTDYEILYQLPNMIRRFLEAFIGFKYSSGVSDLQKIIYKESDKIKVERFLHEFSHQRDLNRSIKFCDINECKTIVNIVLKAVESKDSDHYKTLTDVYNNNK